MKKLLYVCEADSGGIMEYAIRQSAALAKAAVEVHFLCKSSFPKERLAEEVRVEILKSAKAEKLKYGGGMVGKIGRVVKMISDLRSEAKQVAELAEELAYNSNSADLTTEDTESTEDWFVQKQGSAWAGQAGASESDSLASKLAVSPVSESRIRLADGPASSLDSKQAATRHSLPATRNNLGEAEVCVLFACYKEYFAPFWVWPLRRLARRGVVIGTIAHDPVRDFVVGPVLWHRWSVRLGYSFVRNVFVHDATAVDFGCKKPRGIRIHQIPHGPYEVAEPKIGREAMRRHFGFDSILTTIEHRGRCENRKLGKTEGRATESWPHEGAASGTMQVKEQPMVGPKGKRVGASESKDTESTEDQFFQKQGGAQARQAGDSESDSLTSKLADAPDSESHTHSASDPASIPSTSDLLPATPASPDVVFLAFGQIRDGKNLDLFLRAMTRLPANIKLLVAGKGDSGSSKPPDFYQKLAEELGVGNRCRWDIRRIPDEEVGDLFAACDVVLVTYSAKFRSASGVLNAAVSARKPVLASSGTGPLKSVVRKYHLGVFVEPDDVEEIVRGASKFVPNSATPTPDWAQYERENSWVENARNICSALS